MTQNFGGAETQNPQENCSEKIKDLVIKKKIYVFSNI
jgi:hypothetical protein